MKACLHSQLYQMEIMLCYVMLRSEVRQKFGWACRSAVFTILKIWSICLEKQSQLDKLISYELCTLRLINHSWYWNQELGAVMKTHFPFSHNVFPLIQFNSNFISDPGRSINLYIKFLRHAHSIDTRGKFNNTL